VCSRCSIRALRCAASWSLLVEGASLMDLPVLARVQKAGYRRQWPRALSRFGEG
jgi:hypothetical protein